MSQQRAADQPGGVTLFSGPCDASTAHAVRQRIASFPGPPLGNRFIGDVQLVATELITNALKAHADWVDVELSVLDGQFELRVRDTAPGEPRPRHAASTDVGGRGLEIVQAIASAWGFRVEPGQGKTVWARLNIPLGM